jgi:signal transduction histidine kinase/DNA-binding response OmpR family regulator
MILSLLFGLTGCKEEEKRFSIAFSQCTGKDTWRKTMHEGMKRELAFHPGVELIMEDAEGDSRKQIAQIRQLLQQPINLLIVSPNEVEPLTPIVDEAYKKGIPVILMERRTASHNYTAYVGADNYEVGKNAGTTAAALLKGKGTVLEITGLPGSSPAVDRHRGFVEMMHKYPEIRLLTQINGDWERGSVEKNLPAVLKQHPEIDLIYAQNDRMALGTWELLQRESLTKRIKIIGVDGLPGPNEGIDFVAKGLFDATILYPTGGEEAIRTAMKILRNEPFERETLLPTVIIDSTNVGTIRIQTNKLLSQQKDIERQQKKIDDQIIIYQNQRNLLYVLSASLLLAITLGAFFFWALRVNRKINRKLEAQNQQISQQKDQIEAISEQAREANEAKLRFFTNISHEFRTPLTLILGPVDEMLSARDKLSAFYRQELEMVRTNATRLLRLINQLMDFRKIEGNKMQVRATENDVVGFIREIMRPFERIASTRRIDFRLITNETALHVWLDVNMIDKVLFNLLSNAFKFTADGGRIYIYLEKAGEQAIIRVENEGKEMSPEEMAHAFDIFYQGETYQSIGTGLGLAISKEFIGLHQGSISVSSQKGMTVFTIALPLGTAHLKQEELLQQVSDHPFEEDGKIYADTHEAPVFADESALTADKELSLLLIEDSNELRGFIRAKLGKTFHVLEAEEGNQGLKLAFDQVPDVIICDVMLPGMDGLQIARILKADLRTSHIPFVLLTARGAVEHQLEGIQTGADVYLTKPFNVQVLRETINTLLRNRQLLNEHMVAKLSLGGQRSTGTAPGKLDKKFISNFTAYVEEHLSEEALTVDAIAHDLGFSRIQLYRKVKALLGYSVNDYIQQVRLNKAKLLLQQESCSIAEVASLVGFSSSTYFSTAFKAKYQMTPNDFRTGKKAV